ncbi:MAG: histidine kinase [Bacteroidales bacterium]|nr:histidine kinase [Bacteroidales bacterium]
MKEKALNIKMIELIVFVLIWTAIFSIPFFNQRIYNTVSWDKVTKEWIRMSSYLIIFILNIYVLVPQLLFKKKYVLYLSISFLVILVVFGISMMFRDYLFPRQIAMPPMDFGPGMPPMELNSGMPAPLGYKPAIPIPEKSIFMIFADNFMISILVVGAGTSVKMLSKWLNEEGKRKDVEKEQLKTELAFLRHQVSPHFFMNTLNNIHALIDINTETAKDSIIRLSTLMRYLLYETAHGQTSLKKEVEFIESYIALMQLRFSKKVTISVEVPTTIPDIQIPPMLFISILENSFKHGVSYQAESYVIFKLELNDNSLKCVVKNSKHKSKENADKTNSGIGLSNIRKSLALLYGEDYTLDIFDQPTDFEVELTIPIYETNVSKSEIPES